MSESRRALSTALEKNLIKAQKTQIQQVMPQRQRDIVDDYDYSRETYKGLIDKSTEALEVLLALAQDSEHPRAFEVLSTMLKNTADMTDKLMDLQIKRQHVDDDEIDAPKTVTNNMFFGSTTDLQKMLLKKRHDNEDDEAIDVDSEDE